MHTLYSPPHLLRQPGRKYSIKVDDTPAVRDGFGSALRGSSVEFWTLPLTPALLGPSVNSRAALMDPAVDSLPWHFLAVGPANHSGLESVSAWAVRLDNEEEVVRVLDLLSSNAYVPEVLGRDPNVTLQRPASVGTYTRLPMQLNPEEGAPPVTLTLG